MTPPLVALSCFCLCVSEQRRTGRWEGKRLGGGQVRAPIARALNGARACSVIRARFPLLTMSFWLQPSPGPRGGSITAPKGFFGRGQLESIGFSVATSRETVS